ncbi:hypothetical protein GCK72_022928 [Caenorhabditis remanei]|uniref:Major sperm protein n=1 Tax=Caenorhabditis remanei TaxID=31234 RepID=A0A6A5FV89_CAERE|nr:hypothetical protein GCK72_022928 [Caenorhabditis remanei]KAF1746472.1 hypothetical protein GCK72_022928 [Caenorhabditis remanei]
MPLTNDSTSNVAQSSGLQPSVPAQPTRPKTVRNSAPDNNMTNTSSTPPSPPTIRGRKRQSKSKSDSVPSDVSDTENGDKIPYKKPDRKGKPKNKKKTTRPSFSYVDTPHVNVLQPVELPTRRRSEKKAADAKSHPSSPAPTTGPPVPITPTASSLSAATATNSASTSDSSAVSVAVSTAACSTGAPSPLLAIPLTSPVPSTASSSGPSSCSNSSLSCQAAPADPTNPAAGQQVSVSSESQNAPVTQQTPTEHQLVQRNENNRYNNDDVIEFESICPDNQTNVKEEVEEEPVNVEIDYFGRFDDLHATISDNKLNQIPFASTVPRSVPIEVKPTTFETENEVKELGNIATQPMRVIVFNAPFDVAKVNYFKIKNLSANRIGVKMSPTSRERFTVARTIICMEPHESVNVNVRSKVFNLDSFVEDKIIIEWMNIGDGIIGEHFIECDGARNRKTMVVQFSL